MSASSNSDHKRLPQCSVDTSLVHQDACYEALIALHLLTPQPPVEQVLAEFANHGIPSQQRVPVVYFHGGAFVVGSIGIMDNVARELAHASGAIVVSVEFRLAPEHPYPAGLDDCERVTRWALENASRFDLTPASVVVAGESAGDNLATAVARAVRQCDVGMGRVRRWS